MYLVADGRLGPNKAARLDLVNTDRAEHYKSRPGVVTLPKILTHNITSSGWGDLHGPAYKAAVTRQASPCFRALVHKFCTSNSASDCCLR